MSRLYKNIYGKFLGKPSWLKTTLHKKGKTVNTDKNGSFYFNALELSIYDFLIQTHLTQKLWMPNLENVTTQANQDVFNDVSNAYDWFVLNNPKAHLFLIKEFESSFKNSQYVNFHYYDEIERLASKEESKSNDFIKSKKDNVYSEKKTSDVEHKDLEQEDSIVSYSYFKRFVNKNFLYLIFGLIVVLCISNIYHNYEKSDDYEDIDYGDDYYEDIDYGDDEYVESEESNKNKNLFFIIIIFIGVSLITIIYLKQNKINNKKIKLLDSNKSKMGFSEKYKNNDEDAISSKMETKAEAIKILEEQKELLDLEIITQDEYDKVKDELKSIIIKED